MQSKLNTDNNQQIACAQCDLLVDFIKVDYGYKAICPRCYYILYQPIKDSLDKTLVISLTGLLLFLPAVFLPLFHLSLLGNVQSVSLITGFMTLFRAGFWVLAVAVLLLSVLMPLINLSLLFYVVYSLKRKIRGKYLASAFRYYNHFRGWEMLKVYTLGIMVSAVKLKDLGALEPSIGLYCFIGLLLMTIVQVLVLDKRLFWNLIEEGQLHEK